jgi:hypothetical protein
MELPNIVMVACPQRDRDVRFGSKADACGALADAR